MRSLQAEKKRRLQALLNAELYLPPLVDRLSSGHITIDTPTACRWAGWIDSLVDDEAWSIIEPALHTPEAWPDVWARARRAGFSPTTEHHQAIFFTRHFERALEASRLELARRAWSEALASWSALARTTHIQDVVLAPVSDTLTGDKMTRAVSALLDNPLAMLGDEAVRAMHLLVWEAPPMRRPLRFVLDALNAAREAFDDPEEFKDSPLAAGVLDALGLIEERLHRTITDELDRRLKELDRATVTSEELLAAFDGALVRSEHLHHPKEVDRVLLRRGLGLIWDLREIGREEELEVLLPLVERLTPCAIRLRDLDEESRFGLEGAIADLFVFVGEEALSIDDRQEAYETAIEICPGHRNASRLLSYLLLERANRELLKTAALPSASVRVGPIRRRIHGLVKRAQASIERAAELYPDNELLGQYYRDLGEETRRFEVVDEPEEEEEEEEPSAEGEES